MLCSNRPTMSFSLNDWRHKACSHSHQTNSKTRQIAAHLTNTFIHARISQLIYDRTMDTSSTKICPSMFGLLILLTVVFGVNEASFFGAPSVGRRAMVKLTSAADSGVSGRGCQLDGTWLQSFSKVALITVFPRSFFPWIVSAETICGNTVCESDVLTGRNK